MNRSVVMWEHHSWTSPIRVGGRAFAERFLAESWDVAWINSPLAPWNLWGGNDEIRRRRSVWRRGGAEDAKQSSRLFAYTPLALVPYRACPLLNRRWFHRHSLDLTWPGVFRLLERKGFGDIDLLWLATGSPFLPLLDRVRRRRSLFRLSDDTTSFPQTPSSYGALEEEAMRRVDLVVATAASLAERARRFNSRVLLLPNGVDLARFSNGLPGQGPGPINPAVPPWVAYVGAVDSWFDVRRLVSLARALPQARFVIAGPVRIGMEWAEGLPNVELTGPVPPEEVPALLARSRVGIIPFVDSPLTRAIHPVKLYEYFAAGLLVVSSDLEEIRRIGSPALLARSDSDWIDAVRTALVAGRRPEYTAFASRHDWSGRFSVLMQALTDLTEEGRRPAAAEGGR